MAGPQFIHLDGYARNTSKQSQSEKTNINGVIGEALRESGYHSHIDNPENPVVQYGSLDDLASIKTEIDEKIENEKDPRGRKIRDDKNILLAGVTSFAKPVAAMENASGDQLQEFENWKSMTIDFLKQKFGDNLRCVIEHTDETYPHLHFYVLDRNRVSDTMKLHPGFAAKNEADQGSKIEKDRAYRNAMRKFQDEYYENVASYCGLTRLGPQVQRLNRSEWKKRKQDANALANLRNQINEQYDDLQNDLENLEIEKKQIDKRVREKINDGLKQIKQKYDSGIDLLSQTYDELQNEKQRINKQYPDANLEKSNTEKRAKTLIDTYKNEKQKKQKRKRKNGEFKNE